MNENRCHGCYYALTGWWCDNCDQWPCVCEPEQPRSEQAVRTALSGIYTHEGVDIWLRSQNKMLNGERPVDVLETGDPERVWAIIETLRTGAYG